MKRKSKKWLLWLVVMVMGMLSSGILTVFAYTEETETPIAEETPSERESTPFSVPGNGQLVDDLSNDDTKQFLTIQTKNGTTFFLILDRSSHTENVYLLSLIDENDLAEFLEETETEPVRETTPVIRIEPETKPTIEEPEAEQEERSGNRGVIFVVILLLGGGVGSYYYVKVLKPKREEEEAETEGLEFYDDRAYHKEEEKDSDSDKEE